MEKILYQSQRAYIKMISHCLPLKANMKNAQYILIYFSNYKDAPFLYIKYQFSFRQYVCCRNFSISFCCCCCYCWCWCCWMSFKPGVLNMCGAHFTVYLYVSNCVTRDYVHCNLIPYRNVMNRCCLANIPSILHRYIGFVILSRFTSIYVPGYRGKWEIERESLCCCATVSTCDLSLYVTGFTFFVKKSLWVFDFMLFADVESVETSK